MKVDVTQMTYSDIERALANVPFSVMQLSRAGGRVLLECAPA
ncbi:MAG: hypothetical protein Q8P02_05365 [Candidatus Micrarchaeota archaeon]|nr:hypothetical protein [Candidatus Micrarchaeota archaeon]